MAMKQVFEGVKIADFSWVAAGPQMAREFAEHGATVVRVESHRRPDVLRLLPPFLGAKTGIDRSAFGAMNNTNKYGMSLDLSKPKGREVGLKLALWADIVTDGMIPGTMKRWGLDYESLKSIKPDIIMYSTNQHGQYGPYHTYSSYGWAGAAQAGLFVLTGWPDRIPELLYGAYTDYVSPWYLITTLVAALDYRRRSGRGMYFDQSQIESAINFLGPAVLDYTVNGRIANRAGNRDPNWAPHDAYPCRGKDRWCTITARNDNDWQVLCQVMGNPDWAESPRFATILSRKENEDELNKLIGEWTKDYPAEQVMATLQAAGVPSAVVQTCEDLFADPQLKHRQHFRLLQHKVIGPHHYHAPAYKLSKTPAHIWKAGPALGQDNEYVYKKLLGFTDDELAELLVQGVITTETDMPAGF